VRVYLQVPQRVVAVSRVHEWVCLCIWVTGMVCVYGLHGWCVCMCVYVWVTRMVCVYMGYKDGVCV